jgi:hypothetical protein
MACAQTRALSPRDCTRHVGDVGDVGELKDFLFAFT